MKKRDRWWKSIQHHPYITMGIIALVVLLTVTVTVGYRFQVGWMGFGGEYNKITKITVISGGTRAEEYLPMKTLWDWMQLLIVPIVLAGGGLWFNRIQQERERKSTKKRDKTDRLIAEKRAEIDRSITIDNQRETAFQTYLDRMSELLLTKKLRTDPSVDEVRTIARLRTLVMLRVMSEDTLHHVSEKRKEESDQIASAKEALGQIASANARRKGGVIQFLYENGLIARGKTIIDLNGADLSRADLNSMMLDNANLKGVILSYASLSSANLEGADLSDANLSITALDEAYLSGADLTNVELYEAYLSGADLTKANLTGAHLTEADLTGADLTEANLTGADLTGATFDNANLTRATYDDKLLQQAKSCRGTILRDGKLSTSR